MSVYDNDSMATELGGEAVRKSFAEMAAAAQAYGDGLHDARMAMSQVHELASKVRERECQLKNFKKDPNE